LIPELGDGAFGWREGVVVLIVLVGAYMGFLLLRMGRLRRKADTLEPDVPTPGAAGVDIPPVPGSDAGEQETSLPLAPSAWEEAPQQLARSPDAEGLEAEVLLLRDEVDALRSELAALRRELQAEIAQRRAPQAVSPLYNDAMQMATAGHNAATIAERCGISRAEADLVVALVNGQRS